jgi:hypothetical protein
LFFWQIITACKLAGQIGDPVPWTYLTAPATCILVVVMCYVVDLGRQLLALKIKLNCVQQSALLGFVAALILALMGQACLVWADVQLRRVDLIPSYIRKSPFSSPDNGATSDSGGDVVVAISDATLKSASYDMKLAVLLWTAAVCLWVVSWLAVFRMETVAVANRKGYRSPVPLSRTSEGWVATPGAGCKRTILLGTIEAAPPSLKVVSRQSARAVRRGFGGGEFVDGSSSHVDGFPVSDAHTVASDSRRNSDATLVEQLMLQQQSTFGSFSSTTGTGTGAGPGAGTGGGGVAAGGLAAAMGSFAGTNNHSNSLSSADWHGEIELLIRQPSPAL